MNRLVLDIGGSSIKVAIFNDQCQILTRDRFTTPLDSMDSLFQTLDKIWETYGDNIDGIAISMPGVVDSTQGYAYSGGALKYLHQRPFAKELQERYHCPVWIGNDAKCAAIAEVGYGVLQDVDDAIVIILGTGIGGCLIKDKKVHQGKHFSAGEVSSLHTDRHIIQGEQANWWKVSGISGLLETAQKHLETTTFYTGEEIFAMANGGNPKALAAIHEFSEGVALQLFNMQAIFDAEKIAIGGGISAQALLIELIQEKMELICMGEPVVPPSIVACAFQNDANLVGAYYQFQKNIAV